LARNHLFTPEPRSAVLICMATMIPGPMATTATLPCMCVGALPTIPTTLDEMARNERKAWIAGLISSTLTISFASLSNRS
jgi:hypothetical protein